MPSPFQESVSTRYHIYNSLFLNLPFSHIYRTGTLLPFVQQHAEEGFDKGEDPKQIIQNFFNDFTPKASTEERFDMLFNFIQYAERQIVLFDSIEDAAFDKVNDINGKGSLYSLLTRVNSAEQKRSKLIQKLEDFSVLVVLTAHPTQFYPGHVLAIINDLQEAIRNDNLEQINVLLQQLGKTAIINREKPSPYDEAVSLCWYLENVFYHAIPQILTRLINGLQLTTSDWKNFRLIRIGFWPGGDRDGNPFVTCDITLKVAARLKETILKSYHKDVRLLKRRLTFRGIDKQVADAEQKLYDALYYPLNGYQVAEEFLTDLNRMRLVLIQEHNSLFLEELEQLIIKVNLFGFHFASMDIRQDSRKHEHVWAEILGKEKVKAINSLSEAEQVKQILSLHFTPNKIEIQDSFTREVIETIYAIQTIQSKNGEDACHRYIISNCRSASDVINVFHLTRLAIRSQEKLPLDIVPLFETIDDLARAGEVMNTLYQIPEYRNHIKERGGKQTIMLGFSDGTKDGGYLRANWSIFKAKENLTAVSRKYDITVIFFDGRGGPPARGGGNTHDFYASLGDTIENNEVQITIQGQTISSNFGKIVSCRYNLEQLLSAGVEQAVFDEESNTLLDEEKLLLDTLADAGYQSYLNLKQHPQFVPYLEKMTPLPFFSETNIGSRPVKRNSAGALKLEDLRAIPFVGAWAQMKQNIPGFYGVGSALREMKNQHTFEAFQNLYKRSLFFQTLLANSMMSLTKTYYPATQYISHDKEFGEFWKKMYEEYQLSKELLLEVTGLDKLLKNNPINRESIKLRERIVMPLILIQQYALQNLRAGSDKEHEHQYQKLALRCMFGIINAARNSA